MPLLLPALPLNQGPSLHRHYPASSVIRASLRHPVQPCPALAGGPGCGACLRRSARDFPCCHRTPLASMPSSMPRWTPTTFVWLSYCPVPAFPMFELGRHPHQMVSGLAQCSFALRPARSLTLFKGAFYTRGFGHFIASISASAATGWSVSCRVGFMLSH